MTKLIIAVTSLAALSACQNNNQNNRASAKDITVIMQAKSDSTAKGQVNFKEENNLVSMEAHFTGLNEGPHAIHIHAQANCNASDGKSAGGHWNPTNEQHGQWGDKAGYHKGDIGNFEVDADGTGQITFQTNEWCIDCDDNNKNILGKSVIVHQGSDDFVSQPSGNAGARVACGEILK